MKYSNMAISDISGITEFSGNEGIIHKRLFGWLDFDGRTDDLVLMAEF